MCQECPPEVLDAAKRIAVIAGEGGLGIAGGLHVVFEDENVEDDIIRHCLDEYDDIPMHQRKLAEDLLAMPVPYRHMAVQLAWDRVSIVNGKPVYRWTWEDD